LRTAHRISIARACAGVGLSRAAWYRPRIDWTVRDAPIVDAFNQALAKNGRWGFWLCFDWLRNRGHRWNHKRVWRVYCRLKLNRPRRMKRRLPAIVRQPLVAPAAEQDDGPVGADQLLPASQLARQRPLRRDHASILAEDDGVEDHAQRVEEPAQITVHALAQPRAREHAPLGRLEFGIGDRGDLDGGK